MERWAGRVHFYRFFFLPPLFLALPFFLPAARQFRYAWVLGVLALFSLGANFYPYFYPHYIAALTCLMVLVAVVALSRIRQAAVLVLFLAVAQFVFWYGITRWPVKIYSWPRPAMSPPISSTTAIPKAASP